MPIEFRRMAGVFSLAQLLVLFAMAIGTNMTHSATPAIEPGWLPVVLACTWTFSSTSIKLWMTDDRWVWWVNVVAVLSFYGFAVCCNIGDVRVVEPILGRIMATVMMFTWHIFDFVDLCTPRSNWKKSL